MLVGHSHIPDLLCQSLNKHNTKTNGDRAATRHGKIPVYYLRTDCGIAKSVQLQGHRLDSQGGQPYFSTMAINLSLFQSVQIQLASNLVITWVLFSCVQRTVCASDQ
jgi:hypothetical protein